MTTDKVQVGDSTTGTSTSTTWHCPYTSSKAEQGWLCPRCSRINAPWVRQCDCSGNNWTITTSEDWTYKPEWWKEVTCNPIDTIWKTPSSTCESDSAKSDPTYFNVGGSDYKDSVTGTWVNVPKTYTNSVKR